DRHIPAAGGVESVSWRDGQAEPGGGGPPRSGGAESPPAERPGEPSRRSPVRRGGGRRLPAGGRARSESRNWKDWEAPCPDARGGIPRPRPEVARDIGIAYRRGDAREDRDRRPR